MEVDKEQMPRIPKRRIMDKRKNKEQKKLLNNAIKGVVLQKTCFTSIAKDLPLPYPMAFETTEEGGAYICNIKVGDVTYNVKGKGEENLTAENRASDNFLKLYFTQWVPAVDREDNFPYDLLVKYAVTKFVENSVDAGLNGGAETSRLSASVGGLAAQPAPLYEPSNMCSQGWPPLDVVSILRRMAPDVKFEFEKVDFGFDCVCEVNGDKYVAFGRGKKDAKKACAEQAYKGVLIKETPSDAPRRRMMMFGYGGPSDAYFPNPQKAFRRPYRRRRPFTGKVPIAEDQVISTPVDQ